MSSVDNRRLSSGNQQFNIKTIGVNLVVADVAKHNQIFLIIRAFVGMVLKMMKFKKSGVFA